jgi:hypothetical protein
LSWWPDVQKWRVIIRPPHTGIQDPRKKIFFPEETPSATGL